MIYLLHIRFDHQSVFVVRPTTRSLLYIILRRRTFKVCMWKIYHLQQIEINYIIYFM